VAVKNILILRWSQRAHCFFCDRPKGHIRAPKGHSALWKRPGENLDAWQVCYQFSASLLLMSPFSSQLTEEWNWDETQPGIWDWHQSSTCNTSSH